MRRIAAAALGAASLALPAVAQAHVSVHPNVLPAGSNPTLFVRVPNEEDGASTIEVDMQLPPGFTDVSTELPPGWKVRKLTRKLTQPIQTDAGPVTEEVSEIIWSASQGAGIPPGAFQLFPLLTAIPADDAGQRLTFKVIQTYSNGDVVRWIEPPSSPGHPAPTVDVTRPGGVLQDVAGTEAGPGRPPSASTTAGSSPPPAPARSSSGAGKGLAIAALVIGALGLLAGGGALTLARRGRIGAGGVVSR